MMMGIIKSCFEDASHIYNLLLTVIVLILIIYGMYLNIKYSCLKKAAEKVAEVEKLDNLTGEEKFSMVVLWIENDLPKLFKNELIKNLLNKIVQLAYNNSTEFAKNYIKRRTGYDISDILKNLSVTSHNSSEDTNSDTSTND